MNAGTLFLYFLFATISLIPVVKLDEVRTNHQYRVLWILSILVFIWSILMGFSLFAPETFFMYYSRLLTYPVVFGVSYAVFLTFQIYTNRKTPKAFHYAAMLFLILDVLVVLSNSATQWMIEMPYSTTLTRDIYQDASRGWFFWIHTGMCYVLLAFGFIRMLAYLLKKDRYRADIFPFPMILISLILGISLNVIHLFFYHFAIDPTYLFVVIVTFILYMIIYKRDFNVNLILSSRSVLFKKMREMYVIADQNHHVIEYSNNLLERFHDLGLHEGDSLKEFYRKLKSHAIYYHDVNEIKDIPFDDKKMYLHIDDQEYRIDRFRSHGELILLYDETLSIKMMHEIDVIRSHDYMSNVYNRNYFEMQRKQLEKDYPDLGLIMFDVDGLKMFNDYLGHRSGDRLIVRFANILLKLNKIYDDLIPIRFGGDEFVLIAKKADHQKLDDLIKRIVDMTTNPDPLLNISFSYGLTVRRRGELLHTMLKRADERLYELKSKRLDYKVELLQALKKAQKEGHVDQE